MSIWLSVKEKIKPSEVARDKAIRCLVPLKRKQTYMKNRKRKQKQQKINRMFIQLKHFVYMLEQKKKPAKGKGKNKGISVNNFVHTLKRKRYHVINIFSFV